jgi:hypothetical protein
MNSSERIDAFVHLGAQLTDALSGKGKWADSIETAINSQYKDNPWFIPEYVRFALQSVASAITREKLHKWTSSYNDFESFNKNLRVLVVMAGNIPLAGFHDLLSVLITGNTVMAKTSSKDGTLTVLLSQMLKDIDYRLSEKIIITAGEATGFDAVIATGSDNTSRYFEYYFGKYPHIIRKNRNSAAILVGNETDEEITKLGSDIFTYFGLGCRSVSKIWLPEGYEINNLFRNWTGFSGLVNHSKYASNYDYSKAVFLVNRVKFEDSGYLLLNENTALASPVAVLNYERYRNIETPKASLENTRDSVQCVVGKGYLPFGTSQNPQLWDYADGTDTLEFLLKKIVTGIL